jgi:hypothetical protein
MRRFKGLLVAVGAATLLAGCSPTEPIVGAGIRVNVAPGTLTLHNGSNQPAYHFVVERTTAALILWSPCDDPGRCANVPANSSAELSYSAITGYEAGSPEAIVYWWHLTPKAGGGFRPDSVRSVVVRL